MTGSFAPLLARGISREAIAHFGIVACSHSWRYPVRDDRGAVVSARHKRRSGEGVKYWWDSSLPRHADLLYGAENVIAGQSVIVCAGEPDCWLLWSLGIPACTFLSGEGSAPEAAVKRVASLAPSRAVVVYDNDQAGRRGSIAAVRALRAAGVSACAVALPSSLPVKGDVTDLYAALRQDRARFVEALTVLPTIPVPEDRKPDLRAVNTALVGRYAAIRQQHPIDTVIGAVVALRAHQNGRYLTGRCPFHDDHSPSFVVWPELGKFRCYGCEARGDVADFVQRYRGSVGSVGVAM